MFQAEDVVSDESNSPPVRLHRVSTFHILCGTPFRAPWLAYSAAKTGRHRRDDVRGRIQRGEDGTADGVHHFKPCRPATPSARCKPA